MTDLAYRQFSLALAEPLETSRGPIEAREGFLIRLTDDDGGEGVGEATPLPGWTESIEDCERAIERAREAAREEGLAGALEAVSDAPAARHGLALAALDRAATGADTPLYRHLGGDGVERVPVNATVGDGSPDETTEDVREAVDDGFSCCKLKAGVGSVERDVRRVRRVREAVGADLELRLDANGAWSRAEAEQAVEALGDDVDLLEQPLSSDDLAGHADLRGRGVAVAIDEGLYERGIDAVVGADAADAIVVKPMAVGGVDAGMKLAVWARECGVVPVVTTTIDAVLARTAAVHLAAAIPTEGKRPASGLATADLLCEDLAADPVELEGGEATVPQEPGLGVAGAWGGRDA
ncbi:mandelate racemase/muconate lactonizing enzyme family protein [Saliphagus infecundisoli]|uniref:o-succinylbenzoate synthase n=1 Tax=Saliphagus infecundisoli TaxID=1849069 RepID=A0ABD5QG49_9EURY|nr:enolase C-terminal domain-like protein [Saliphagus infecundisoli]